MLTLAAARVAAPALPLIDCCRTWPPSAGFRGRQRHPRKVREIVSAAGPCSKRYYVFVGRHRFMKDLLVVFSQPAKLLTVCGSSAVVAG